MVAGRSCARCQAYKPASEFRPNPANRCGLSSYCNDCQAEARRRSKAKHKDKYNAARRKAPTPGTCVVCSASFEGRTDKLYCSLRCQRIGSGEAVQRTERRRQDPAERARYNAGNVERMRRRRDRLSTTPNPPSRAELAQMRCSVERCGLCDVELTLHDGPTQAQTDHIVPVAAGGLHVRENIRVLCRDCNNGRPRDGRDL